MYRVINKSFLFISSTAALHIADDCNNSRVRRGREGGTMLRRENREGNAFAFFPKLRHPYYYCAEKLSSFLPRYRCIERYDIRGRFSLDLPN